MPVTSAVPETVLTVVAAATVFTVMLTIGLGIVLREFRWVWGNRGLVARALFSVLVPAPGTRTAVAISSAARNPGLALLVATLNRAAPEVGATVLAYLVVAAVTVLPYAIWRYRLTASSIAN
jgi:hypothetical protein